MSIEKYSYKVCVFCEKYINVFVSINRAPRHIWLLILVLKSYYLLQFYKYKQSHCTQNCSKHIVVGREKLSLFSSWELLDFPMGKLRKSKKGEMIVECNKQR